MDPSQKQKQQEVIEITNRLSSRGLIRAARGNLSGVVHSISGFCFYISTIISP